jgi:acyl carrier protein
MNTLDSIKQLAAKQFGRDPDSIDENVPIDQLGIDSLGFLEFLFELEDHFEISIPQESVMGVHSLKELVAVIDTLIASKSAASP